MALRIASRAAHRHHRYLPIQRTINQHITQSVCQNQQLSPYSNQSSNQSSTRSFATFNEQGSSAKHNFGICIVPAASAWVIERFGKFNRVLTPGLHFLLPFVDRIAYVHSLKEQAILIQQQQAITADNVTINIDGVLYVRVMNPEAASYGVNDLTYAIMQLAQTTMRSELGKITLDETFANRESLNASIVASLNQAALPWGLSILRYEIKDIIPPATVKYAMDMQAEAERKKRSSILDSEGDRQAAINVADGERQAAILKSQGDAAAILAKAEATAKSIELLATSIQTKGGSDAVALQIASQYISAFASIAKEGNTMLLPANAADPSAMIAQATAIYQNVVKQTQNQSNAKPQSNNQASNQPQNDLLQQYQNQVLPHQ